MSRTKKARPARLDKDKTAEIKNLGLVLAGEETCPCGRKECDGTCPEKYLVLPEYITLREEDLHREGRSLREAMKTCSGDCEPMCYFCNEQADIAADAIANGEYVREY